MMDTRSPIKVISASRVRACIASAHWLSVQALLIARRKALCDIDPVPILGSVCLMAATKPDTVRIVSSFFICPLIGLLICPQNPHVPTGPCKDQYNISFIIKYIHT